MATVKCSFCNYVGDLFVCYVCNKPMCGLHCAQLGYCNIRLCESDGWTVITLAEEAKKQAALRVAIEARRKYLDEHPTVKENPSSSLTDTPIEGKV